MKFILFPKFSNESRLCAFESRSHDADVTVGHVIAAIMAVLVAYWLAAFIDTAFNRAL